MANNNDDLKKWRWRLAIMAADTWVDPSARGSKKKTGNLKPLAALFASGAPVPPKIYGLLADLLSRHRLKSTTQRTPAFALTISELEAWELAAFAAHFRRQNLHGPITKAEMDNAKKVLQARAKAVGDGHREFDGKAAAIQLRQEQRVNYCDYCGFNLEEFERALSGRDGSIVRMKKKLSAR